MKQPIDIKGASDILHDPINGPSFNIQESLLLPDKSAMMDHGKGIIYVSSIYWFIFSIWGVGDEILGYAKDHAIKIVNNKIDNAYESYLLLSEFQYNVSISKLGLNK